MNIIQVLIISLFLVFSGCHKEIVQPTTPTTISQCQAVTLEDSAKYSLTPLITKYFASGSNVTLVIEGRMTVDLRNRYYILGRGSAMYLVKDNEPFYAIISN